MGFALAIKVKTPNQLYYWPWHVLYTICELVELRPLAAEYLMEMTCYFSKYLGYIMSGPFY